MSMSEYVIYSEIFIDKFKNQKLSFKSNENSNEN